MKKSAFKAIKVLLFTGLFALMIIISLEKCNAQSNVIDQNVKSVDVQIDLNKVSHTMAGGIGASWHAMGADVINYPDLIGRDNRTSKGSAYGGNPPVIPAYDKAWEDVLRHARWLGLDFIRVEFAMDMYEPEREHFVWDNDQMKTLYRILDHCQKNGVDVYMTMMWQGVQWNAHPGINRLQSSPKSVDDYAKSYAELLDYLVKTKGFTCIHWITVNNEPGMPVGWWTGPNGKPDSIMPAIRATRKELDKRGLNNIALCGSDGHGIYMGGFKPGDPSVGALSIHCYDGKPEDKFKEGLKFARELKLPFFIAEMGTFFMGEFEGEQMAMGGPRSEAPKSYEHQIINAEKILVGLNMGVDGFNRWSFVNRGDLDGQWQLIRTWNPNLWDFKKTVEPEPVPYYSFGIITRFTAKHSSVLESKSSTRNLVATALHSPKGQVTIYLLNLSEKDTLVNVNFSTPAKPLEFKIYQITKESVSKPGFDLPLMGTVSINKKNPSMQVLIPGKSITTYTTYDLAPNSDGVISE